MVKTKFTARKALKLSIEYREERTRKTEKIIENLLSTAPSYVKEFYEHMHNGKREITTQSSYVRDVIDFIKYEKEMIIAYDKVELCDIPIDLFESLTVKDLNEYRNNMKRIRMVGNSSMKKKFSALAAFYRFLNSNEYTQNNPMRDFEFPAVNKHRIIKLDADLSNQLLSGIMANDKYLLESDDHSSIVDIPDDVRLKRERLVLRNYAICCLFLGSGLRVSELVGLDLSDINFRLGTINIIAKGGDEIQVFFGDEVKAALRTYLDGVELPKELIDKYPDKPFVKWCKEHMLDKDLLAKTREAFSDEGDTFYHDVELLCSAMRRQGRDGLNPKKGVNAVFITTRGDRMSVRSVELMIKEMAKTYLPDYDDKELFSPHKLRATCATRILTQTGDIQLASTQLNHKGIAVTAAFYAEIKKEQQRDKIRKLDMNEW